MTSATTTIAQYLPFTSVTLPLIGTIDIAKLLWAVTIFALVVSLCWFVKLVVLARLRVLASRSRTSFDDVVVEAIESIHPWVYVLIGLNVALSLYTLPGIWDQIVRGALYLAFVWQAITVAGYFIEYFVKKYLDRNSRDGVPDPGAVTMAGAATLLAKIVLWVLGIIFVLSNIGVEVTSLIAGLGIGGIAIAFALQGVLSDLFASFSLYLDRPFRIGDFIVIGNDAGTVEKIGIKTTRIRTLQGEELVVSNTELTTARVQNFKKMEERRIVMKFGITYETPQDKIEQVDPTVEAIFTEIDGARLDRVHFESFGDFALIFELVYHVENSSYDEFMDIQETFNMALLRKFAELGIEFAYPTQLVYHRELAK